MEKRNNNRLIALIVVGLFVVICLVVAAAIASITAYMQLFRAEDLQLSFAVESRQEGRGNLHEAVEKGVLVIGVEEDSPADAAGLRRGSIILKVNGQEVNSAAELRQAILNYDAGDTITLTVLENDAEREIQATLVSARPYLGVDVAGGQDVPPIAGFQGDSPFPDELEELLPHMEGPNFRDFPPGEPPRDFPRERALPGFPQELPMLPDGIETAVFILTVVPESPAEAAGLQAGDAIIELDGNQIDSQDSFAEQIGQTAPGEQIVLTVLRGNESMDLSVTLGEKSDDSDSGYLGIFMGPQLFQQQFFYQEDNSE